MHLYRGWMQYTDGFVLIHADTGDNEDYRLEYCVIFTGC